MTYLSDHAVCLVVDRRCRGEWPRIQELFAPMVGDLTPFMDGDGTMFPLEAYDQIWGPIPSHWQWGRGAYQHFLAVQAIVRLAKSNGWPDVLLVEDDCVLTPEFHDVVGRAVLDLLRGGNTPDVLYYGANHRDADTFDAGENLIKVNGSLTTHLVKFYEGSYDAILGLQPRHVIDNLIARHLHPVLNCYAVWPSVALQKPGWSFLWGQEVDYTTYFESKGRNRG